MDRKIKNYTTNQISISILVESSHKFSNTFSRSGNPDNIPVSSHIFSKGKLNHNVDSIPLS